MSFLAGIGSALGSAVGPLISKGLGSLFGMKSDADAQKDLSEKFAKRSIQWRVKDAERAGVHPLYALGANVSMGPSLPIGGGAFDEMGQGIGRAADALLSNEGRNASAVERLALERAGLENELLRAQISNAKQAGNPPGMNAIPAEFNMADANKWMVNRHATPAQMWENQYGEPGEWIGGGFNMLSDTVRNTNRWEKEHFTPAPNPWAMGGELGSRLREFLTSRNSWLWRPFW